MSVFALVHGGGSGGWCWEPLVPELEALGHSAITPDLPIEDPTAGAQAYAQTVEAALGSAEDVVAVGHSLGGLTVPILATLRPVRHMVFLGAMVPVPGVAQRDYLAEHPGVLTAPTPASGYGPDGRRGVRPWPAALDAYYHDCPPAAARRQWERTRIQAVKVMTEACPIDTWPETPSTYILMREDRSVAPEWSRRVALERFGRPAFELDGGHSPFLARPAELARVLSEIARPHVG